MKLSILLIFSLGIFLPYLAMSQCEICDSSAVLKKGIYRSLKEFKANKPSGTSNFTVLKAPLSFALDDADFATYKLVLDNPDSYKKMRVSGDFAMAKMYISLTENISIKSAIRIIN